MRVLDLCDDGKLRERYRHKMQNAARRVPPVPFALTFDQYCTLMREAGVKSSQLTRKGYHLARIGDVGPYAYGNCRFVPYLQNVAEKKINPEKISAALIKHYETNPGSFTGLSHSSETKKKIGVANSVAQAGQRNSQFGTCWITNGTDNRKISRGSFPPRGWRHGRICAAIL